MGTTYASILPPAFYDGFNDATGTLTGDGGGTGWTSGVNWGTGTGPGIAGTVTSGSLLFPDGTSGTGNMVGSTTGGFNSTRLLPPNLWPSTTTPREPITSASWSKRTAPTTAATTG